MKDLVSIIVTCYNHEKYIAECLKSIFLQSHHDIELLVIDSGATNQTKEIISAELANSPFERTESISQSNSRLCLDKNKGLNWSKGEFILFVNADSYLENEYIKKLVSTAQTHNTDIIYTDIVALKTNTVYKKNPEFELESYLSSNYIEDGSLIRRTKLNGSQYDLKLDRNSILNYDFFLNLILANHAKPQKCCESKLMIQESSNTNNLSDYSLINEDIESYMYVLNKYILMSPTQIFNVVKKQSLALSNQLVAIKSDNILLNEENVNQLKDFDQSSAYIQTTNKKENKNPEFQAKIAALENENHFLKSNVSLLKTEKNQLLNSKSYRLGNYLFKPLRIVVKIIKNPKLLINILKKIKRALKKIVKKVPSPKTLVLKNVRTIQRSKNNYEHPKRVLIFVIYEDKEQLQPYKRFFLEAIAGIVDEVLIVVNGTLPDADVLSLSEIGQVVLRENQGYDTAAFRYGIEFLGKDKLSKYDELLLVNDTNVGPIEDFSKMFSKMNSKKLDFWGISYGEEQNDFTQFNKYGFIPLHLQSYFLVIEKSLLNYDGFYDYWEKLTDTNSRNKAIGKHETVFTKHFENLGFKHGALTENNFDSPMYIHPLTMVKEGIPIIKYTAFANDTNDKFAWQGLNRETEVPQLIEYIKQETNYPPAIIDQIMDDLKNTKRKKHILLIDGVENVIPQLTTYRVQNKKEQLESLGYDVWTVNLSGFQMGYAEHASTIIIYRAPINNTLIELIHLAKKYNKPVLYDIDDLVIDVKYTNQLTYVQQLSVSEKKNYDDGVVSYGEMMELCDGIVTSTKTMQDHLFNYKKLVLLNRNLANQQLVEISKKMIKNYRASNPKVKIGYFSGSITHNENFELIKKALIQLLEKHANLELHLVGHLDIPNDLKVFQDRIKTHPFVPWEKLPELIAKVDINLAPLVKSIFNEAKSEIKWIEASLVKVPTAASNIGAFQEMIQPNVTGLLIEDDQWFDVLDLFIQSKEKRERLASNAYEYVLNYCITSRKEDQFTTFIKEHK